MNAFFVRGAMVIREWCHRNFLLAQFTADASHATSGEGNWLSFFSASRSAPAPMIQRPTIITTAGTGTEAAMGAKRVKPSIVRVIRVIRLQHRHWAGKSRFQDDPLFDRSRTAAR
jgi:hypothetical protein